MNRKGSLLPSEDDPDRTDQLPVLDPGTAEYAEQDDLPEPARTLARAEMDTAGLRRENAPRDAAIAELTTLLRQKSFALSRAEKDLEHARTELMRASQAAGRDAAGLEMRLQELEREHLNISALHDERRAAIGGLEDALSDAREREHHLEARITELAAQQQASVAAHEQDLARLTDTEERLRRATRETLSAAGRQESQRLEGRIGELQDALDAARGELASGAEELAKVKDALAMQLGQVSELKTTLAERDAALAAAREPDSQKVDAVAGPDDPTITGNDRNGLLLRISELSAGIEGRDDRIAKLESELSAARRPAERPASGSAAQAAGELLPARYLVRLDGGAEVVHVLSRPKIAIGRTPDNDLQIRESYISRVHAFMRVGPDSTILEDAASRNGVFVNDKRVRRELLKDGDIVILGKAHFRFQVAHPGDR